MSDAEKRCYECDTRTHKGPATNHPTCPPCLNRTRMRWSVSEKVWVCRLCGRGYAETEALDREADERHDIAQVELDPDRYNEEP